MRVIAPSRLHFGLFIESHGFGRVDGGAGVAVANPNLRVSVARSSEPQLTGPDGGELPTPDWLVSLGAGLRGGSFRVVIEESLPRHVGLGSETALRMATALACSRLVDSELPAETLGTLVGRGGTSGVGVHASRGGFVLDAGHDPGQKPLFVPSRQSRAPAPTLASHHSASSDWRVIHVRPKGVQGLCGPAERQFFNQHCPVPSNETAAIIELVEHGLKPALEEQNLSLLQLVLGELQLIGLKAREWRIQGAAVKELRDSWDFPMPLALSSMGPTSFTIVHQADVPAVLRKLEAYADDKFTLVTTEISSGIQFEAR